LKQVTKHVDRHESEPRGHVLVSLRLIRGTASDVEIDTRVAQLWTIRQGKPVRVDSYADVAAALDAAGLPE
jgi:hypothetical protein